VDAVSIAAALIVLVAQTSDLQAVYCDPPIFIPPSEFSTRFHGEVIGIIPDDGALETSTRRVALVQPRALRMGQLPSEPVEVIFYVSVDNPCAHMQRTPTNGDLVDVYLNAEDRTVGWSFVEKPDRPSR
jgi:hypothetical protein